jgi:hypothetical protein
MCLRGRVFSTDIQPCAGLLKAKKSEQQGEHGADIAAQEVIE